MVFLLLVSAAFVRTLKNEVVSWSGLAVDEISKMSDARAAAAHDGPVRLCTPEGLVGGPGGPQPADLGRCTACFKENKLDVDNKQCFDPDSVCECFGGHCDAYTTSCCDLESKEALAKCGGAAAGPFDVKGARSPCCCPAGSKAEKAGLKPKCDAKRGFNQGFRPDGSERRDRRVDGSSLSGFLGRDAYKPTDIEYAILEPIKRLHDQNPSWSAKEIAQEMEISADDAWERFARALLFLTSDSIVRISKQLGPVPPKASSYGARISPRVSDGVKYLDEILYATKRHTNYDLFPYPPKLQCEAKLNDDSPPAQDAIGSWHAEKPLDCSAGRDARDGELCSAIKAVQPVPGRKDDPGLVDKFVEVLDRLYTERGICSIPSGMKCGLDANSEEGILYYAVEHIQIMDEDLKNELEEIYNGFRSYTDFEKFALDQTTPKSTRRTEEDTDRANWRAPARLAPGRNASVQVACALLDCGADLRDLQVFGSPGSLFDKPKVLERYCSGPGTFDRAQVRARLWTEKERQALRAAEERARDQATQAKQDEEHAEQMAELMKDKMHLTYAVMGICAALFLLVVGGFIFVQHRSRTRLEAEERRKQQIEEDLQALWDIQNTDRSEKLAVLQEKGFTSLVNAARDEIGAGEAQVLVQQCFDGMFQVAEEMKVDEHKHLEGIYGHYKRKANWRLVAGIQSLRLGEKVAQEVPPSWWSEGVLQPMAPRDASENERERTDALCVSYSTVAANWAMGILRKKILDLAHFFNDPDTTRQRICEAFALDGFEDTALDADRHPLLQTAGSMVPAASGRFVNVVIGNVKGADRALAKAQAFRAEEPPEVLAKMPLPHAKCVCDFLRLTCTFEDPLALALFYACMEKEFKVLRVKNKYDQPPQANDSPSILCNLGLDTPDGSTTVEVQLMMQAFVEAKRVQHKSYEVLRSKDLPPAARFRTLQTPLFKTADRWDLKEARRSSVLTAASSPSTKRMTSCSELTPGL